GNGGTAVASNNATVYDNASKDDNATAKAGNDSIDGGFGSDTISGDAMTGHNGSHAAAYNTAKIDGFEAGLFGSGQAEAGNDTIHSGSTESDERIAGDALTLADGAIAMAINNAEVTYWDG